MPYYGAARSRSRFASRSKKKVSRKRSVKFSKKRGILKKRLSTKRTYKRKAPVRRFAKRRFTRFRPKAGVADSAGAKFLADATQDPAAGEMYRSIVASNASGLNKVRVRGKGTLPDVFDTKFKYSLVNNPLPDITGVRVFFGNSIIDPGISIDTQDCGYVIELSNIYSYYRVTSSRCTVHCTNTSPDQYALVVLFKTIVPPVQWPTFLPQTLAAWNVTSVPHKMIKLYSKQTEGSMATVSDWCSTSQIFNSDANNEDFSGNMPVGITPGTVPAPAFQWFWGLKAYNVDGTSTDPDSIIVNVDITYWTTLDGPKTTEDYPPAPEPPLKSDSAPLTDSQKDKDLTDSVIISKFKEFISK